MALPYEVFKEKIYFSRFLQINIHAGYTLSITKLI